MSEHAIWRSAVLAAGFVVGPLAVAGAAESPEARLADHVDVSPAVVMARHDYGSNITCVALDEGLVFVDAGLSTAVARQFRQDMEARFERGTIALVLTHGHLDHFLGMGAFADVEVIAAAAGRELIERQLAIEFSEERIEAYNGIWPKFRESIAIARPFLPTVWVEDERSIGAGARQAVFRNTGGHSACSSHVYYEPEGVVVAGDLVQVGQYPYFGDPSTDLDRWITTLKGWAAMDVRSICPGHGWVVGKEFLAPVGEYFETLVRTLGQLKAEGVSLKEVAKHPRLPRGYWDESLPAPVWWDYCIRSEYGKL